MWHTIKVLKNHHLILYFKTDILKTKHSTLWTVNLSGGKYEKK